MADSIALRLLVRRARARRGLLVLTALVTAVTAATVAVAVDQSAARC